jgi:hypothetical protein
VVKIICEGAPREMGFAQGAAARSQIHSAHSTLAELEAFRIQQPRWLPYSVYRWLAEQKASRFLSAPLLRDYPAMNERLAGIAEGAGIALKGVLLINGLEPSCLRSEAVQPVPERAQPSPFGATVRRLESLSLPETLTTSPSSSRFTW